MSVWEPPIPEGDPYGEEYGDWEDPITHSMITMCTGCAMCEPWEGLSYNVIRSDRRAQVREWRERGETSDVNRKVT